MSAKQKAQWPVSSFFDQQPGPSKKVKNDVLQYTSDHPGCDNYDPQFRHELGLTKLRLMPLDSWFNDLDKESKGPRILLLTGPDGCGKTAAVKVLAREKKMHVIEYIPPDFIPGVDVYTSDFDVQSLKSFLLRVGRYSEVGSECEKKLIVLENLPETITEGKTQLMETLLFYSSIGKFPLILICSENSPNATLDANARSTLSVDYILFKRATESSIKKVLNRAIQLRGHRPSAFREVLDHIAETCDGNIRKAISEMKFYVVHHSGEPTMKIVPKGTQSREISSTSGHSKEDTGIFHAVGRVLYAKRRIIVAGEKGVLKNGKVYGELEYKPLDIAEKYSDFQKFFFKLMQTNYPKTFSSVEDIAVAADYLSLGDQVMSEWTEKEVSQEMGFSIAVGGVMNSCFDPVRQWTPLTGETRNAENMIKPDIFWEMRKIRHTLNGVPDTEIALEIIPQLPRFFHSYRIKYPRCVYGLSSHDISQYIPLMKTWMDRERESNILIKVLFGKEADKGNHQSSSEAEIEDYDDD